MDHTDSDGKIEEPMLDAQLQQEIDQAMGDQSVEQLMQQHEPSVASDASPTANSTQKFHAQMKRGRISAIRGDDVFVDLGEQGAISGKLQGLVPLAQFDRAPRIGSIMDFVADHADEAQGLIYLSREGEVSRATWEQLQRGSMTDARVMSVNKGGLELEMVGGIQAFMPASQIDLHHVGNLESFVGQKLEGIVQEIDYKSKKVVLSRRQVLQQQRDQACAELISQLEVGQIREGIVTSIVEFGAFVDLGGLDGLIHVSDLSYQHVNNPAEMLERGQTVKIKVLKIDAENKRISLGLKQVEPDPWQSVEQKYPTGEPVTVRVIRTTKFGAFVELEAGIEALLPMSEMSWKHIHQAEEIAEVGAVLSAVILKVDLKQRRIAVSLKQAQGDPWIGTEHKYAQNTVVDGQVKSVTDFGAFIELEAGVEGLVHISELADRRVDRVEDVLQVGDLKQFRILEISEEQRKIKLSLKMADRPDHSVPSPSKPDTISDKAPQKKAQTRKPRRGLKSGLGNVQGIGLGQLNLNDFK